MTEMTAESSTQKAPETPETAAKKYRLTGTVQGIGFRHYVKQNAEALGIDGWARNECDGSLTIFLHGGDTDKMYSVLMQGPPGANVASMVELCVEETDNTATGFAIY